MSVKIYVIGNGEKKSLADWSRVTSVSPEILRVRLRSLFTQKGGGNYALTDDQMSVWLDDVTKPEMVKFEGKSIVDIAKETGISVTTLYQRRRHNNPNMRKPAIAPVMTILTINGEQVPFSKIVKDSGVKNHVLRKRFERFAKGTPLKDIKFTKKQIKAICYKQKKFYKYEPIDF